MSWWPATTGVSATPGVSVTPGVGHTGTAIDAGGLVPDLAPVNSWTRRIGEVDPVEVSETLWDVEPDPSGTPLWATSSSCVR